MKNHKLFFILGVGFILRLVGVQFGLPDIYHADEPIIVNHAVQYGSWDFNPHFFWIPPLTSYLLFIAYGFYFLFGVVVGWFSSLEDFKVLFLADPTSFYLIARGLFGA